MTASHPRRMAVIASLVIACVAAVSACGSSSPRSGSSTSVQCSVRSVCTTSTVALGATTLTVSAAASQSGQTVTAELVTDQQLHCPSFIPAGGALAIFSSTATDAPKSVTYSVTGTAGQAVAAAHRKHPHYLACFGSPQTFSGYAGPRSNRAAFVQGDGLYEAALFPCTSVDTKPCFSYAVSGETVTLTIQTSAGDPRTIG